jgi:hypothetical protein
MVKWIFLFQIHLMLVQIRAFNQQLSKIGYVSDVVLGVVEEAAAGLAKEEERREGEERWEEVWCVEGVQEPRRPQERWCRWRREEGGVGNAGVYTCELRFPYSLHSKKSGCF